METGAVEYLELPSQIIADSRTNQLIMVASPRSVEAIVALEHMQLASSSAEDAPRGMTFLYNPNRLNVATSRAQCACILVAAPRIFEPECRTPEQMRWANGLCRYRELAREVGA